MTRIPFGSSYAFFRINLYTQNLVYSWHKQNIRRPAAFFIPRQIGTSSCTCQERPQTCSVAAELLCLGFTPTTVQMCNMALLHITAGASCYFHVSSLLFRFSCWPLHFPCHSGCHGSRSQNCTNLADCCSRCIDFALTRCVLSRTVL